MLKPGPLPKYYQLVQILREQILSGRLGPNDQLPTEETLCQAYGVSRGTVRRAITTLTYEGLIRAEQGRGTFVNAPRPKLASFALASFDEDMDQQQRQPATRLLTASVSPATPEVAGRLGVVAGEPVIYIARLRLADDQPVIHETRYLARELCPALLGEDLETESIHWLLVHKHRLPMIRATYTIEVHLLDSDEADLLQMEAGAAAFFVDRLTYTLDETGERPAVWYQALYRGDNYQFRAEFQSLS
jgi:GntR family transcriptional regulator